MNYTRTSTLCGPPGCMKKQTRGPVAYPGNKGFITAKQASFNVGDSMSTLNKYAAAARCIRRQRVLKKNAAAYIKLAAEEDRVVPRGGYNAGVSNTPRPAAPKPGAGASIRTPSVDPNASTTRQDAVTRLALDKMGLGFPWPSARDEYGHGGIASDVYSLADEAWDFLTAPELRADVIDDLLPSRQP